MHNIIQPPFTMADISAYGPNAVGPTYTRATITPALAQQMLSRNTHNRALNLSHVDEYTRDMLSNNWHENGDGIRFDWTGTMVDGQHTATAIMRSGVTINTLVVTNLDPAVQATIDAGRKRSAADMFTLASEANSSILASVTARVWKWDRGDRRLNGIRPTKAELAETLNRYPSLRRSVEIAAYVHKNFRFVPPSSVGTAHHLFLQLDPGHTAEFMERLARGLGLGDGDPVAALRKKMMNTKDNGNTGATIKRTDARLLTYIIMTWNAEREGRTLERVQYTQGATIPDPR